jgi:hypothetical protein
VLVFSITEGKTESGIEAFGNEGNPNTSSYFSPLRALEGGVEKEKEVLQRLLIRPFFSLSRFLLLRISVMGITC